ncbi:Aminopyrimidine aminohydrolase OS=Castellaniella defragrans OX=75697 GN=HNR28_001719 PE=3 SV=1 [Castellaniella defragrans]
MTLDFSAGPHTRALWQQVHPTLARIERLPFLNELAGGTLNPVAFVNYLQQDSLYLIGYARAMSLLAAKAPQRDQARFWSQSSATAIAVEEGMHTDLLADPRLSQARALLAERHAHPRASPTTLGYVSYLTATAATESYAVGVAGVLPCFWVYAHMGKVLVERATTLASGHPYETWIAAYDSPEFDDSTRHAVAILEAQFAATPEAERERMRAAFEQACVYEWHFWATAHQLQGWALEPTQAETA